MDSSGYGSGSGVYRTDSNVSASSMGSWWGGGGRDRTASGEDVGAAAAGTAGTAGAQRVSSFSGGAERRVSDLIDLENALDTVESEDDGIGTEGLEVVVVEGGSGAGGIGSATGAGAAAQTTKASRLANSPSVAKSGGKSKSERAARAVGIKVRQHPDVTVIFIDIVGFSEMCNEVKPFTVLRFLEQYFDLVARGRRLAS